MPVRIRMRVDPSSFVLPLGFRSPCSSPLCMMQWNYHFQLQLPHTRQFRRGVMEQGRRQRVFRGAKLPDWRGFGQVLSARSSGMAAFMSARVHPTHSNWHSPPFPPLAHSLGSLGSLVLLHPSPSSGAVPKIFIDFENVFMALRVSHKNIFYIYSLWLAAKTTLAI